MELRLRDYVLPLDERPHIMGVLNVTPDSFWGASRCPAAEKAVERALEMVEGGADIIDVGGESTRPGAEPVGAEAEAARIRPVVKSLLDKARIPVSVDTRRSGVAREMLDIGAHMVNDVSGLRFDGTMAEVVRDYGVPVVIMHMRGIPGTMQSLTDYEDVVSDVKREIAASVAEAQQIGIAPENIVIDPGIGFSKTASQCVEIIARLDEFLELGKPVLVGPSRKSFIGKTLGLDAEDRLEATITSCIVAVSKGASVLRVHDVTAVSRAVRMFQELKRREAPSRPGVTG
jgi:dihydropteroate synthase